MSAKWIPESEESFESQQGRRRLDTPVTVGDFPPACTRLFQRSGDDTGLPARRAYYLGYLIAEEVGKTMSMREMAKLDCAAVRPVVVAAVERLRTAHATVQ